MAKNATPAAKNENEKPQRATDLIPVEAMRIKTWDEDTLRGIDSFEAALALTEEKFGPVVSAADVLGDGFRRIDNKAALVGVPLVLMEWNFYEGDFGKFVAVRALGKADDGSLMKVIFVDGSSGICEDLARYTMKTQRNGGLVVRGGLRVSEYTYYDEKLDRNIPAQTFYLDLSA